MRVTKKSVTVDAVLWTGGNAEEVQSFLFDGNPHAAHGWVKGQYVDIGTLEGLMVASPGDWIIKGVKGEFYPCKPDIFALTYSEGDGAADLAAPQAEIARLRAALERIADDSLDAWARSHAVGTLK